MFGEEPNLDFDRNAWIRQTHVDDLPAECMEVLKVASCFYTNHDISVVLGIPSKRVAMWLDYAIDIIFGGWPDMRPSEVGPLLWFDEHRFCCTAQAHAELEYQHYPEAERWGYEQPWAHRKRREHCHGRRFCAWGRPPSVHSHVYRTLSRRGCAEFRASRIEPPGSDPPGED
jgi:hypothetical protein